MYSLRQRRYVRAAGLSSGGRVKVPGCAGLRPDLRALWKRVEMPERDSDD